MVECGYGICWRVLNSQFFGVAQRRRRVFIVGYLGAPCPATILFEPEGSGRDPETGEETWERIAGPLGGGAFGTGRRTEDDPNIVRQAISSKWAKGSSGPAGDEHHNLVATLNSGGNAGGFRTEPGEHIVAFMENQRGELRTSDISAQFSAGGGKPGSGYPAVAFESRFVRNGRGAPEPIAQPLKAESGQTGKGDASPLLCAPTYPGGVRDSARLPLGLDSARYRALGNAVTVSVAHWIAERIVAYETKTS
jgi:DNA (cytosine-5)-methyltransferase 1